jgi:hypothetical protein
VLLLCICRPASCYPSLTAGTGLTRQRSGNAYFIHLPSQPLMFCKLRPDSATYVLILRSRVQVVRATS